MCWFIEYMLRTQPREALPGLEAALPQGYSLDSIQGSRCTPGKRER